MPVLQFGIDMVLISVNKAMSHEVGVAQNL